MTTTRNATSIDAAMQRALALAALGPAGGANPRVGCVLLDAHRGLLAEGFHRGAGTPHAEADALAQLPTGAATGATAVVTLEPCDHRGRTGACSTALIDAGVARVVLALPDPNPTAAGGAARLRAAGVVVEQGPGAAAATALNEHWTAALVNGRPWTTVKWASSLDGRIAAADGTSRWISGASARADVHRRRAEHGAVLVGTGTLLADDPALTARAAEGAGDRQPVPVIVGDRAIPADAAVRAHPRPLLALPGHEPRAWLAALGEAGITSVLVEGGPTVASAFLRAGLADEVLVYLAPTLLGGDRLATTDLRVPTIAAQHRLVIRDVRRLGDDLLVVARPASERED